MDARYEGPNLSRFLSEDPVSLQAGPANRQNAESLEPQYAAVNGFVKASNSVYLASPQNLNPYSYVDENPLKYTDPSGKQYEELLPYITTEWPDIESVLSIIGKGLLARGLVHETEDAYETFILPRRYPSPYQSANQSNPLIKFGVDSVFNLGGQSAQSELGRILLDLGLSYAKTVPASQPFNSTFSPTNTTHSQSITTASPIQNSTNPSSSGNAYNQLGQAAVSYANSPGSNPADPTFAAAPRNK